MGKALFISNNIDLSTILKPDTAFNSSENGNGKKVYYISDIHLLHHIKNERDWKKQVEKIVKSLYSKELIEDIIHYKCPYIIFCGDTCSSSKINQYFYHLFKIRYLFYLLKSWNHYNDKIQPVSKKQALVLYKNKLNELKKKLNKVSYQLNQVGLKNKTLNFLDDKSYPNYTHYKISKYKELKYEIKKLKEKKDDYLNDLIIGQRFNHREYDFLPMFVILGNHELNDFKSIDEAVNFYTKFFNNERIWFLHNAMLVSKNINILGGIGFAKFNSLYNANTLCSTNPPITREEEILESEKFLEKYNRALDKSISDNKILIVISHYPIKDWLPEEKYHSICVYFNGHSHQNNSIHTETVQVYADNQIGYKNKNIQFKSSNIGIDYNPFIDYKDGYYEINTIQYNQFLLHKGQYIQGTSKIDEQLQCYNAKFYMVKQNGFYSFFVINQKTGTKICAGGRLRTISKIKDIKYFYNYFSLILNKYSSIFTPYRKIQEQISNELKQLGFDGKIHGCIIDINYFCHILLDPIDGKLTFYYSPKFGIVKIFNSFDYLVRTLICNNEIEFDTQLLIKHKDYLILQPIKVIEKNISDFMVVDRKNSIYALSSRINQIQRIFDCNILREWSDDWVQETLNENSKYLVKTFPVKSDEDCDQIIADKFDEFINIEKEEKGFVLWSAKKLLKQEMMYSICRKFISTYFSILEKYDKFGFEYCIWDKEKDEYNYVSVNCCFKDVFSIHKKLLAKKFGHNDVSIRLDYDKTSADITVDIKGKKELLNYIGNYNYINNELVEISDLQVKKEIE